MCQAPLVVTRHRLRPRRILSAGNLDKAVKGPLTVGLKGGANGVNNLS